MSIDAPMPFDINTFSLSNKENPSPKEKDGILSPEQRGRDYLEADWRNLSESVGGEKNAKEWVKAANAEVFIMFVEAMGIATNLIQSSPVLSRVLVDFPDTMGDVIAYGTLLGVELTLKSAKQVRNFFKEKVVPYLASTKETANES